MLYTLLGISLLFVAIGFLVTEKNAKYILAGYNTMKAETREKVDLKSYLSFFRKFHVFLGVSFFVMGTMLYFSNEKVGGVFLALYPILAYAYFLYKSSRHYKTL